MAIQNKQLATLASSGQLIDRDLAVVLILTLKDADDLQVAAFALRDLEQGFRRAYLALMGFGNLKEVPFGGPQLAEHPTHPSGYEFDIKAMRKESPTTIAVAAYTLPCVAVLLAIWIQTTKPDAEEIGRLLRELLDLPANAVDSFRKLLISLAGVIAVVRQFRNLIDDAQLGASPPDSGEEE